MNKIVLWAFLLLAACGTSSFRDNTRSVSSVSEFEPDRYLGKWYEIARYPNWFEKDCVGVTANYAMRSDGQIDVTNTCRKDNLNGEISVAKGIARIEGVGKLSVTFTPWLPFVRGDYWVLGLHDYDIAVVGNPKGSTGWILARTPTITDEEREWADQVLINAGYDSQKLIEVLQ